MRARHILFEYDRAKTVANLGQKLLDRLQEQDWMQIWSAHGRSSGSSDDFKRRAKSGDALPWREFALNYILEKAEAADPSRKKAFVLPILNWYLSGHLWLLEDLYKAEEPLKTYMKFKNRFTGLSLRDVSFNEFNHMMAEHAEKPSQSEVSKAEEQEWYKSGQAVLYRDDDEVKIVVPKTKAAAQFFGRHTQWCTSALNDQHNQFAYYNNKGPLYIILIRATGQRWQFQFETAQFMDENDRHLTLGVLWKSPLRLWIDEKCREALEQRGDLLDYISVPQEQDFKVAAGAAGGAKVIRRWPERLPDSIYRVAMRHGLRNTNDQSEIAIGLLEKLQYPTMEDAEFIAMHWPSGFKELPTRWKSGEEARRLQLRSFLKFGTACYHAPPSDLTGDEIATIVERADVKSMVERALDVIDFSAAGLKKPGVREALRAAFEKFPALVMEYSIAFPWDIIKSAFIHHPVSAIKSLRARRDLVRELDTKKLKGIIDAVRDNPKISDFSQKDVIADVANELARRERLKVDESFAEHGDVDYDPHFRDPHQPAFHNFYAVNAEQRRIGQTLRGPHQYRELSLMLLGHKPVAMPDLTEAATEKLWRETARQHGWGSMRVTKLSGRKKGWLFCLPGQEWRMHRLAEIYDRLRKEPRTQPISKADHARIGLLLGYSKEAVKTFLTR